MTIQGVEAFPLKRFEKADGAVLHMLRHDAPHFEKFGEIYFSFVNPGHIKGWKLHREMTQFFAVPVGAVKFVIHDKREGSKTKGETLVQTIGDTSYALLRVPPNVWYSFASAVDKPSLIANCTTMAHRPDESTTIDLRDPSMPSVWPL